MEFAVYRVLLVLEFSLALPIFLLLLYIKAPYGKFATKGWGPAVNARAAWMIMELPALALPVTWFLLTDRLSSSYAVLCIILWVLHYGQRTITYPLLLNRNSRRVPLLIILFSIIFNTINGYINGYGVFVLQPEQPDRFLSPLMFLGIAIFLLGLAVNMHSDKVLRKLRKPGETDYKEPQEGLFKLVSSPHYFGEILEWCGWLMITLAPAAAAFLLFTTANLIPRALSTRKWYRENFPDYPERRKAVIPYIL